MKNESESCSSTRRHFVFSFDLIHQNCGPRLNPILQKSGPRWEKTNRGPPLKWRQMHLGTKWSILLNLIVDLMPLVIEILVMEVQVIANLVKKVLMITMLLKQVLVVIAMLVMMVLVIAMLVK